VKRNIILAVISTILTLDFMSVQGAQKMSMFGYDYGYQKYGKETIDSIQANGSVMLEGTKILGLADVNGSLNAEESAINSLRVNGLAELSNCVIENKAVINGSLKAVNTDFQSNLSIASQKIVLKMCTVNSLTVREVNGYSNPQIIDLRSEVAPFLVEIRAAPSHHQATFASLS